MGNFIAWLFAQSQPAEPIPYITPLISQGALGLVLIALLLGQLLTKPSVDQERRLHKDAIERLTGRVTEANLRAEHAENQRDQLLRQLTETLPIIRNAAAETERLTEVVEDAINRFEREQRRRDSDGPYKPRG